MRNPPLDTVVRHAHQLAGPLAEPADAILVRRLAADRDSDAAAALVRRHGPMVLAVCRRSLGRAADADDAFQAAFLVLVRDACRIRVPGSVAGWLHGVAVRVCREVRVRETRRRAREQRAEHPTPADPTADADLRELRTILDEELDRLPAKYRDPLVLHHLEERTKEETARLLGWAEGTVSGRLARARELLRGRLERRGVTLPAGGLVALLASEAAPAVVPDGLARAAVAGSLQPSGAPTLALAARIPAGSVWANTWLAAAAVLASVTLVAGAFFAGRIDPAGKGPSPGPAIGQSAIPDPRAVDATQDPLPPGAVARLGTIRFKSPVALYTVACSPDGTLIAAGDEEGDVRVFDAATGREIRRLTAVRSRRMAAAVPVFSPDGKLLAAGTSEGRLAVWDAAGGDPPLWQTTDAGDARGVIFSPDGKNLATSGAFGEPEVRLWDAASGKAVGRLRGHTDSITAAAFAPDGKQLVTASHDGTVRFWDPASGKELRKLHAGAQQVTAVAWSPDGTTVAWSLAGDKGQPGTPNFAFIRDVVFWDATTGQERARAKGPVNPLEYLAFTPDGRRLLGHEVNGTYAWDPATGKQTVSFHRAKGLGHYRAFAFTPDSKTVISPFLSDLRFTDLATSDEISRSDGPRDDVCAVACSPDGKAVAVGSRDGCVYVYAPATGRLLRRLDGDQNGVTGLAFAPDGVALAVAAGHSEVVRIWDPASGKLLRSLPNPSQDHDGGHAGAVAYSPDGKRLAVASYGLVRVFDPASGQQVRVLKKSRFGKVNALAFSPDGTLLAAAGDDKHIRLWELATGGEAAVWPWNPNVQALAFSPDGTALALGGDGGWCQVWDVPSGQTRARMKGHQYAVHSVAFTPDGKRLVTAGTWDGGPRLWDAATGEELRRFRGHYRDTVAVAVAPDGKTAVSGGEDGQAIVWDLLTNAPETAPRDELKPPPPPPAGAVRLGEPGTAGTEVAFSPDGKRLAAARSVEGSERAIAVWDVAGRREVWRANADREGVNQIVWSPDGSTLTTFGTLGNELVLTFRDAATGKELRRVSGLPSLCQYALSPDGKTLAARRLGPVARKDPGQQPEETANPVLLIDLEARRITRELEGHAGQSVAWSPDGKWIATGSGNGDRADTIRLWDPATGGVVREWKAGQNGAPSLVFLSDGRTLVSGSGGTGTVRFWSVPDGKLIREVKAGGPGIHITVSADGGTLASNGFESPVVVRRVSGSWIGEYEAGGKWPGVALSPDGKMLGTAGNGQLLLWPLS